MQVLEAARERLANIFTGGEISSLRGELASMSMFQRWLARENSELKATVESARSGGQWVELGANQWGEPTRQELTEIVEKSRAMAKYNPLIKRAAKVSSFYTFGKGVSISSRHTKAKQVLADFWDDLDNAWACSTNGMAELDRELTITGNLFFAFFVSRKGGPTAGRTVLRTFPIEEITDLVRSEHDRFAPQFYARTYTKTGRNERGQLVTQAVTELYPDWRYNPSAKPKELNGKSINWDVPIMHVKTGGGLGWKFGLPEHLAGLDWARGYSKFLQDRATVASALAKFVAKARSSVKNGASAVKARLGGPSRPPSDADGAGRGTGPTGAGGTVAMGAGGDYEAINVKGATIDPDEGRRLLLMVACDAGLTETFFGDVSVGTLATATSMDQPTKYLFALRQEMWKGALTLIGLVVLINVARAGTPGLRVAYRGTTPSIRDGNGTVIVVDVDFPPLLEHEVDKRMGAIEKAGKFLPGLEGRKVLARQTLAALGEDDIEDVMNNLDFTEPEPAPAVPPAPGDDTADPEADPKQAQQNPEPGGDE